MGDCHCRFYLVVELDAKTGLLDKSWCEESGLHQCRPST